MLGTELISDVDHYLISHDQILSCFYMNENKVVCYLVARYSAGLWR